MDFSKKRLVSFGDSYTFGQNVTLDSDPSRIKNVYEHKTTIDQRIEMWRTFSNTGSYTNHLKKQLQFADAINLGIPGASNKHIYDVIYDYCALNDVSNDFFVIGLTSTDRDLIYTKNLDLGIHSSLDYNLGSFLDFKNMKSHSAEIVNKMSSTAAQQMMTYYFNDMTLYSNFILIFESIINLLEKKKVPYIIVDLLNSINSRIDREDTLKIEDGIEPAFWDGAFNKDPNITYRSNTRIRRFKYDLLNSVYPKYLNRETIKQFYNVYPGTSFKIDKTHLNKMRVLNLNQFVGLFGMDVLGSHDTVLSPVEGDLHWNVRGHKFAALVLEEWIRHCYE